MHRTVKNQQSGLPFLKCQAYNLQNNSVTKKDGKAKGEERRKEYNVGERRKDALKNMSSIVAEYKTVQWH